MNRRDLLKAAMLLPAVAASAQSGSPDPTEHLWQGYDFGNAWDSSQRTRLDQGPFDIDQDEGWQTILFTTPSEKPLRNPGLGLVGYTWEENGPALAVRSGKQTLQNAVEELASLAFVDVLYIRCDWRNVQSRPGRLDLDPVWPLTLAAAKRYGLRVAFRIQLSNPEIQPQRLALPDFVRDRVPLVKIGRLKKRGNVEFVEPRYDHPEFQKAFAELNDLLVAEFDGNPLIEWVDLMQYGFWGEGHTSNLPNPFPSNAIAEQTFLDMTHRQLSSWKKTPLAVNTQPDISKVGNRAIIDAAVRAGAWVRSDSIFDEEPVQIEELANRPPWLAAILEDGSFRQYEMRKLKTDSAGVNILENYMLHVLDIRANYWSLWTEAANLAHYNEAAPRGLARLRANIGYRLRPAWVWQRKRQGAPELIIAVSNRGVAGVPGVLWLQIQSPNGSLKMQGALDPGHPHGNGIRQASFVLPRSFSGPVQLSAQLEIRPGVKRPVAWACEQPPENDGSISIRVRSVGDPNWRKDV